MSTPPPFATRRPSDDAILEVKPEDAKGIQFQDPAKPARNLNASTAAPIPPTLGEGKPKKTNTTPAANKGPKNKSVDVDEHLLTLDAVCERYHTEVNVDRPANSRGLMEQTAAQRLLEDGPNILSPPKKKHPIIVYLELLFTLFNILLMVAGILVYILYGLDPVNNKPNLYLGAILFGVAFANAFIEFYQKQKSASLLESFLNLIPQKCFVIREGRLQQIMAGDLVKGDVCFVRMGDKVPADLLIFSASDFKVDNSSLTGESDPQERRKNNTFENPLEATNLVFFGTLAVSGEGYGIVIRTGDHTVLGQIAGLTTSEEKAKSPLSKEIDKFVKIIAFIAITTAVIFFIAGYLIYRDLNFVLIFAIGVCVAWVPEGLPATVTMLLTIAAKRMATRNVLVKDLQGVETLGAITLLATDKTGTLTRNQMTVTNVWSCLNLYSALRNIQVTGNPIQANSPGIPEIMNIATLCSRAKFDRTDVPIEQRQVLGDATEAGLIRFAAQTLPNFEELRETYPKVFELPFNSETKWHMSIHRKSHANGPLTLYLKGAPERVLRICTTILTENGPIPLGEEHRQSFNETYEQMASKGHRVLAFAQLLLPGNEYPEDYVFDKELKNYPTNELCFVGLTSLEDPPKHGVREAIGRCRSAGIQVMMVTGDHPLTAEAIGRKINLMLSETKSQVARRLGRSEDSIQEHEYNAVVIHGEQIDELTEEDWENIFSKNEIIFARTSPRHKLEIVKKAQKMGHIVGVTGDGVNDSPALKKADLGIAMNLSGSDVSKEAAAMILLDDNFSSTVHGIEEGRLIFANLKKSIQYTITHIVPEVIPQLLFVIVPVPLPLSSILILVIDLGFEIIASISYAWEVPESRTGLMNLPPRKPVTPTSYELLLRQRDRELKPRVDPESGEIIPPTFAAKVGNYFKNLFDAGSWRDYFNEEGEELVDFNLLSWAYLEVGMIEAIGGVLTYFIVLNHRGITPSIARDMASAAKYFTPTSPTYNGPNGLKITRDQQQQYLSEAQGSVYLAIMIMQLFNLFACKAKYRLPFGKFVFKNKATFVGVVFGAILAFIIAYVPPFNVAFGTSYTLNPIFLLVPLGMGVVIIIYASLRMLILRKLKPISYNPEIPGLMMFPTVRSFTSRKSR